MDPETAARLERLIPELVAKMRKDMKEFPLRRDFVVEHGPGRYAMETTEFEYYYADFPELDGMVRILENLELIRNITRDHKKRFVIGEEFADYLLSGSVKVHPAAPVESAKRRRGFPANAVDHMKVVEAIANIPGDWTSQLKEVCVQLHRAKAMFPKTLRDAECVESWKELANTIQSKGNPSPKGRVRAYIKYRIAWAARNRSDRAV